MDKKKVLDEGLDKLDRRNILDGNLDEEGAVVEVDCLRLVRVVAEGLTVHEPSLVFVAVRADDMDVPAEVELVQFIKVHQTAPLRLSPEPSARHSCHSVAVLEQWHSGWWSNCL